MTIKSIQLLSHASVIIKVDGLTILTDPWFFGTAFNDGWELFPQPNLGTIPNDIKDVDLIWISHEHPDHLHFPTLKYIKDLVPDHVQIGFQSTNSTKVFDALKKLGYVNFLEMPHMERLKINSDVELAIYAHRHLDCCLAVFIQNEFWLLNVNDTELNENDTRVIRQVWGCADVLLNQFSIAGSQGIPNLLKSESQEILTKMCAVHDQLGAEITIPIASFMRFSCHDNFLLNSFANNPLDVSIEFSKKELNLALLSIQGEALEWQGEEILPANIDTVTSNSREKFLALYTHPLEINKDFNLGTIPAADVTRTLVNRISQLNRTTTFLLWNTMEPIVFKIPDWDSECWELDFKRLSFTKKSNDIDYDMKINSQPLEYTFKMPFGVQTLGVSGRYEFHTRHLNVPKTWKLLRIITSLDNASINISFKGLFSRTLLKWVWLRRKGLLPQITQQISRFFK